jgi:hypothetical protein
MRCKKRREIEGSSLCFVVLLLGEQRKQIQHLRYQGREIGNVGSDGLFPMKKSHRRSAPNYES